MISLSDKLAGIDVTLLVPNGFDEAFMGYITRCGEEPIAIYDTEKCIDILMVRDGMSWDDASEHFKFNVAGGWHGAQTPGFLTRLDEE